MTDRETQRRELQRAMAHATTRDYPAPFITYTLEVRRPHAPNVPYHTVVQSGLTFGYAIGQYQEAQSLNLWAWIHPDVQFSNTPANEFPADVADYVSGSWYDDTPETASETDRAEFLADVDADIRADGYPPAPYIPERCGGCAAFVAQGCAGDPSAREHCSEFHPVDPLETLED
jgi:hypothetical protein